MTLIDEFVEAWNTTAMVSGWRACLQLNGKRRAALTARFRDKWWADNWRAALEKASPIAGLRGQNDRGWRADIDWFIRPGTVVKILEGGYDQWCKSGPVIRVVPTADDTKKKLAEMRAYEEKARADYAKGLVGSLAASLTKEN